VLKKPKDRKKWERRFYEVMRTLKSAGGRILAGAESFDVDYYNCFVYPNPRIQRRNNGNLTPNESELWLTGRSRT